MGPRRLPLQTCKRYVNGVGLCDYFYFHFLLVVFYIKLTVFMLFLSQCISQRRLAYQFFDIAMLL